MNKIWSAAAAFFALQFGGLSFVHATLLGDDVDIHVELLNVAAQLPIGGTIAPEFDASGLIVVDPGVEVDAADFLWQIDFTGNSIDLTVKPSVLPPPSGVGGFTPTVTFSPLLFIFSDLEPRDANGDIITGARISGVSLTTNIPDTPPTTDPVLGTILTPGRTGVTAAFGDHSVHLFLNGGMEVFDNAQMSVDLSFALPQSSQAPAPATAMLFLLAALVPVLARRAGTVRGIRTQA